MKHGHVHTLKPAAAAAAFCFDSKPRSFILMSSCRLTPRGRPRQYLTTPRSAPSFRSIARSRDASHTPSPLAAAADPPRPRVRPQHYMPNQGLFEREDVYALMNQSDDDDNDPGIYGELDHQT